MLLNVAVATREVLGPDELWVLERYAEGWSCEEMAAQLGVGSRGVRANLDAAFRKIGVRNRAHAAVMVIALQRGLLSESISQAV